MRAFPPLLLAAAVCAGPLLAPAQPGGAIVNVEPSAAQAGTYALEPVHTRVLFKVSHLGFTNWYGDFSGASGTLSLNSRNPSASHVEVSLPMTQVSTTNTMLDSELKGPDWFDAAKYPAAVFRSGKITMTGTDRATVDGELTLHGVTRPVSLQAKFNASGVNPLSKAYTVGFEATGTVKRSDFGITTDVPLVGDDVTLIISAAFIRKGP